MLREAVSKSNSFAGVARFLSASSSNSSREHLKRRIKLLNIDCSHFIGRKWAKGKISSSRKSFNLILLKSNIGKRLPSYQLRRALIEFGRKYECCDCGIEKWKDKKLLLEIHHIDGDWSNNVESNLIFLCPNCHSQKE